MPALENARWEAFCRLIVSGKNQADAYRAAGFEAKTDTSVWNGASRLSREKDIQDRILELKKRAAARSEIKREDVFKMLLEDRTLAREAKQASAAIRAVELIGKEIGMFVDRKEVRHGELDDIPIRDIESLLDALRAEAARRVEEAARASLSGTENRALLPGPGAFEARAISETHELVRSGGEASEAANLPG